MPGASVPGSRRPRAGRPVRPGPFAPPPADDSTLGERTFGRDDRVVSQIAELLERFRHPATPGPPVAAGGVPEDAAADLQAELRPLLAAIDEVEDQARAVVEAAGAEAAAVRERGAHDAEAILDAARRQAAALRTAPPDEDAGDSEARDILAEAEAEADAIRRRARERIAGLVARVIAGVAGTVSAEKRDVAGVGRW